MARRPRIEFNGVFYHAITRGNQRQKVFKDKEDYIRYLTILGDYKDQYKYFLYAYVSLPTVVTSYLRKREDLKAEVERVMEIVKRSNINSQV